MFQIMLQSALSAISSFVYCSCCHVFFYFYSNKQLSTQYNPHHGANTDCIYSFLEEIRKMEKQKN